MKFKKSNSILCVKNEENNKKVFIILLLLILYKTCDKMKSPLFWSSFVFTTNVWTAFKSTQYLYSFLFLLLLISSLIVHNDPTLTNHIFDKIMISLIVIYGFWKLTRKWWKTNWVYLAGTIIAFLFCIWVYIYGFFKKSYCFDPTYGTLYHMILHFVGSLGHHILIFM